jgi:hypothetical protein
VGDKQNKRQQSEACFYADITKSSSKFARDFYIISLQLNQRIFADLWIGFFEIGGELTLALPFAKGRVTQMLRGLTPQLILSNQICQFFNCPETAFSLPFAKGRETKRVSSPSPQTTQNSLLLRPYPISPTIFLPTARCSSAFSLFPSARHNRYASK